MDRPSRVGAMVLGALVALAVLVVAVIVGQGVAGGAFTDPTPVPAAQGGADAALSLCLHAYFDKTSFTCSQTVNTVRVTSARPDDLKKYDVVFATPSTTYNAKSLALELSVVDYKGAVTRLCAVTENVAPDDTALRTDLEALMIADPACLVLPGNDYRMVVYLHRKVQASLDFSAE